ncbi:unnamed protein product [Bursaphelenchus okinawaensis]|uniref:Uncharacterized protein n=1 Tax=Bursaphelenchus okinawaensis TaxID=465554 RepID=A0A811KB84_9BILA|nr:unnamed protein product [Bursaphelenchus okinawaensis]CAG9098803.1 unnamed protein product [Bursaphelenchus okinawaensis]
MDQNVFPNYYLMNSSLDPSLGSKVEKRPLRFEGPSSQEPPRRRSRDQDDMARELNGLDNNNISYAELQPVAVNYEESQVAWQPNGHNLQQYAAEYANEPGCNPDLFADYLLESNQNQKQFGPSSFDMNEFLRWSSQKSQGKAQELASQKLKTDENYKKAEKFDVYVLNDPERPNNDIYYDHENNTLYTRKLVKVKFQVGTYIPDFLSHKIRMTVLPSDLETFDGYPCKEHKVCQEYAFSTHGRVLERGKKVVLDILYPLASEEPHFDVTFSCNNSCFKSSKKLFDLIFELHDDHGTVYQKVAMKLKVCAVPVRDGQNGGKKAKENDVNEALQKISANPNLYFVPIYGDDIFRRFVQMMSDVEMGDRHKNQSLLHNTQIVQDTDIRVWLARFNQDIYTKVFTQNNIRTMKQLCWKFHKDPRLFANLKIPPNCALAMTKSFNNWLYTTLQEDPGFMMEYMERTTIKPSQ